MEIINVIAAAAAAWIFGAVWYMALSKPWMRVSGVKVDEQTGRPAGGALPFILSAVAMVVVAGFMRHVFAMAGIGTIAEGLVAGLGVGLFFIAPWTLINNAYSGRPFLLTVIDSGYSVFGCAIIGAVLTAF
ncbi:DUF1761 domain-containing protein [Maritimibacter sp. UBA3975]|uniref:DUF1761 domain-containing protein n=1 Tax=Maritimibacter sp. UBA3975 TaxID=1946833 RepID=UPI000C0ABD75|nr:DUF1761 domain-containing protein [Maritimibacter sp. UBA3975]MAM63501.1 hypothetical protein [Maritimibacter sp.]